MYQCWIQSQLERGDQAPRYLEIQNVQGGKFRASGTLTAEIPTYSCRMRLVKLGNLHNARLASEFKLNLMCHHESRFSIHIPFLSGARNHTYARGHCKRHTRVSTRHQDIQDDSDMRPRLVERGRACGA